MDNYHLTNENGLWKFKKEKSDRLIKKFETKTDGIDFIKEFLKHKGGSLKIHKADGSIQEERTYPKVKDPKSSKG